MNKFKYLSDSEFSKELKDLLELDLRYEVSWPKFINEAIRRLENSLDDQIQFCARDLPEGSEISIHVENGAGWVESDRFSWDGSGERLATQVKELRELIINTNS